MKFEAASRVLADTMMNNGNATVGFDESRVGDSYELEGSSELPIYSLPQGHNLDDGLLKTGIDCDPEKAPSEPVSDPGVPELNAGDRLVSSIQNTVQNEGTDTFISHTVEADKEEDSQSDSDISETLKRVSDTE